MTTNVDTRAVNVTGGKVARACDACTRRLRACWYCPADDAFLCQSCDVLIHSANQLAKRHERVRLPSPSPSPELMKTRKMEDKTNSVWYEGFRRKARTPRSKGLAFLQINSNDPLVPELGGEEEEDGFFSFSSIDENEDSLNCCVPVFDHFSSEMGTDDNGYGLVPDEINITTNLGVLGESEKDIMDDDGLIGLLPLDMNLGELTMDVESLLEEEQPLLGVTELNDIGPKEEDNIGFEINREALRRVKYEDEEEVKCDDGVSRDNDGEEESEDDQERKTNLFLSLDYEAVITAWDNHGSPWKIGFKSEFNLDDCWQECLLGVNTYPLGRSETRQQERRGGGSDGEREWKVMRYREKRRKRLFTKNIRYEVRKLNAEQRPRIKGRFVKRTSTNQVSL